jgi:pimeloyl-ACP methyl ester carboxylesterase
MAALGFAPEPVRGIGVLRLHGGGLRSILATPATEPLVVGSCLVGSAARGADPTTERGRGRVAMPAQARALQAAGRAVELIAVDRPESLSASATGLHRSGSSSLRVNRGEKFLCGGFRCRLVSKKPCIWDNSSHALDSTAPPFSDLRRCMPVVVQQPPGPPPSPPLVMPSATHFMSYQEPDTFNDVVLDFLAGL